MSFFGKPYACSECRRALKPHKAAGRPRFTCSQKCAETRHRRLKREARWMAENYEKEMAYRRELAAFIRGESP